MNSATTSSTPSASGTAEAERVQAAAVHQVQHAETFTRFRWVMLVGAVVWPAFALADLLALRTFAQGAAPSALLGPRAIMALAGVAVVVWLFRQRTVALRTLVVLDQVMYGQANFWIGVMSLSVGGLTSPYLVGSCLVVTARMFSLPFEWKRALALNLFPSVAAPATLLIGVAAQPQLRPQLSDPDALAIFALHVAYLLGTATLMAAGAHFIHTLRTQLSAERSIGRYRLRHRLGMGGMGEVWAAWHAGLKRDVALKILKQGTGDPTAIARFEREVQATAELTHPNTVRVFDYGTTDDGLLYYAMELLRGEDLGQLVEREGALPPARAVYLLGQAARALGEAHAHGIVHRDVKPANLFITSAGSEGDFVKVLDFGIARIERAASDDAEQRLTRNDAVVGTPKYMAPEVMRGDAATARADVYGLGAALHVALTGRAAFVAPSKAELIALVLSDLEAEPINQRGVSGELAAVVARALAKAPARRFENADALEAALRDVPEAGHWKPPRVGRQPTTARPPPAAPPGAGPAGPAGDDSVTRTSTVATPRG